MHFEKPYVRTCCQERKNMKPMSLEGRTASSITLGRRQSGSCARRLITKAQPRGQKPREEVHFIQQMPAEGLFVPGPVCPRPGPGAGTKQRLKQNLPTRVTTFQTVFTKKIKFSKSGNGCIKLIISV